MTHKGSIVSSHLNLGPQEQVGKHRHEGREHRSTKGAVRRDPTDVEEEGRERTGNKCAVL